MRGVSDGGGGMIDWIDVSLVLIDVHDHGNVQGSATVDMFVS